MKKFIASPYSNPVEIEVERETESCVWIKGRKTSKVTGYQCIFDSYADARSWRIKLAQAGLDSARRSVEQWEFKLAEANSL